VTVIAIDGPAGAGKSSVGREVARALGWTYLDTGAMYRAVALAALERGIDPGDGSALARLAASLNIEARPDAITLDGVDVRERIRSAEVTRAVSQVSAHRGVRDVLSAQQRRIASAGDVVMEGRDIGVMVAPDADLKVWLTAGLPERARRRARQLGIACDRDALAKLERELDARDTSDAARAESPLARASDAHVIDSTGLSLDEVVRRVLGALRDDVPRA